MLSILLKRSKHSYFLKYFEPNWNNIKSTWKGIKPLITLKDISTSIPRTLNHNNKTVINPVEIAIIFNKHFVSIAEKARASLNYSHKYFSEYKENNSSNSFILSPTNKNEISSIISSFNPNKSVGPNSIPKILKLLKDQIEIPSHFYDIYYISFSVGIFPSVLKTTKFIPVHKKDSNIDYNNYPSIVFYQILKKFKKNWYVTELLNF